MRRGMLVLGMLLLAGQLFLGGCYKCATGQQSDAGGFSGCGESDESSSEDDIQSTVSAHDLDQHH